MADILDPLREVVRKWRKWDDTSGGICPTVELCCHGECASELESLLPALENALDAHDAEVQDRALEEAASECNRHAAFCKDEAHKGGDFQHLITRADEAAYNAERIRAKRRGSKCNDPYRREKIISCECGQALLEWWPECHMCGRKVERTDHTEHYL